MTHRWADRVDVVFTDTTNCRQLNKKHDKSCLQVEHPKVNRKEYANSSATNK